jgi:hypothetical protein
LSTANSAKASGIEIFAIDFGAGGTRDAWAALATNSVNNAGTSNNQADIDAENADGDHFFIPLIASDMKTLFETIAEIVCPGVVPPAPPGPPPPLPPPPVPSPISIGSWEEINIISP